MEAVEPAKYQVEKFQNQNGPLLCQFSEPHTSLEDLTYSLGGETISILRKGLGTWVDSPGQVPASLMPVDYLFL